MKLECQKEKLKEVIALAERMTGKNLSLPVLARVLLIAEERHLIIRATNLDLGLEWQLPAKVEKTGQVLVNGAVLANFLANIGVVEDKIKLELAGENLSLTSTRHKTVLKVYPAEDFPTLPEIAGTGKLALPASDLLAGLRSVAYAAALNDIKPEIASVYLHTQPGCLLLVATDSFRLAESKISLSHSLENKLRLIIPIRNITEIMRVLERLPAQVELIYDQHQLSLKAEQVTLTSRLIDGIFPDYQQLIPTKSATQVTLDKTELLSTLRVANIFTDRLNHVTLKVRPEEQLVEMESRSGEVGEDTSLLPATISGEELIISFNSRYLIEGLQSVMSDKVFLQFNGKTKAIVVTGAGEQAFTYLIMPLNR
ncbi:MAG: DNA polymerase III subunit beta [Patescibacteria group bacterium]